MAPTDDAPKSEQKSYVHRISSIDSTPDGQLVTANWDGTVHLWDLSKTGPWCSRG